MADGEKKKTSYGVGAFASMVHSQQRYVVFNLDCVNYDSDHQLTGASRYLPHAASHELMHTLGFDHPRTSAGSDEKIDTRGWDQIRRDVASSINQTSALGSKDSRTGTRTITYCLCAPNSQIPHGNDAIQKSWGNDPNAITVENLCNLEDGKDKQRNASNQKIKDVMKEAFAEHERLFNVKYVETKEPAHANLLIYAANIPTRPQPSFELTRGSKNAYTHDVTIMTYNQADKQIWPLSAVGDIEAAQRVYGLPLENAARHTLTPERLADHSGVLWDHKPMAIKLTGSPMVGSLMVDMDAHPFKPAITGMLRDIDTGAIKQIRQHIGSGAAINELDATGSSIGLDITGTTGARIKVGKSATVRLNGRNNNLTLGPGADDIIHQKGFGHVVDALSADDAIRAKNAKKLRMQAWDDATHEKGTLVTFIGDDDKPTGSLFVKNTSVEDVSKRLKDLTPIEAPKTNAIALDAIDMDDKLKPDSTATFKERGDIVVSADKASGFSVSNRGGGSVIVKMTQPEYDSRTLIFHKDGVHEEYYALKFRNGEGTNTIHLLPTSKIAITGPDGNVQRIVTMAQSQKEVELDIALKKGTTTPLGQENMLANLPKRLRALEEQLG